LKKGRAFAVADVASVVELVRAGAKFMDR